MGADRRPAELAAPVTPTHAVWDRHVRYCAACERWWLWVPTEGRSGHVRSRQVHAASSDAGTVVVTWHGRPARCWPRGRMVDPGTLVAGSPDRHSLHTCLS